MATLTRRERLRRCYFHLETDRPAVYSRALFPPNDPTYDRLRTYFEAHTEMKAGWSGTHCETPLPIEVTYEPYSDDFRRRVETLRTPKGPLRRTFLESLKGQPGMHETYFVNNADEAERYLSLPLPEMGGDVSAFFEADAALGDKGIADAGLGRNPGGFVAGLCGSETFAMMSITDRDVLHRLCQWQMAAVLQRLKFLVSKGVGPFFALAGQELIVPPLHGPADFADFNTRYDKPIADEIHNAGGRLHVHSHGPLKKVFQGFIDAGVDVLHPVEPPPQGDILPAEAKALARGTLCIEGNIQIHRMYEATPEAIRHETEALIRDTFDDRRGLIVSPTASPYIRDQGERCFAQYKAMVDAVVGWGG